MCLVIFSKTLAELLPYDEKEVITTNSDHNRLGYSEKILSKSAISRYLGIPECEIIIYRNLADVLLNENSEIAKLLVYNLEPVIITYDHDKTPEFLDQLNVEVIKSKECDKKVIHELCIKSIKQRI